MARRRDKGEEKSIASRRIAILLHQAELEASQEPDLADAYAQRVRRLAMKVQIGLPKLAKALICRGCSGFKGPNVARTRIRNGQLVQTCLRCGHIRRQPLGSS